MFLGGRWRRGGVKMWRLFLRLPQIITLVPTIPKINKSTHKQKSITTTANTWFPMVIRAILRNLGYFPWFAYIFSHTKLFYININSDSTEWRRPRPLIIYYLLYKYYKSTSDHKTRNLVFFSPYDLTSFKMISLNME